MRKWLFTLCACAFPYMANASELCSPSSWCFDASIGIEALYWKPYTDDFLYGEYSATGSIGRSYLTLETDYDWGFRLFANIADSCHRNFLDFEWVRLATQASRDNSEREGFLLIQYGFAGGFEILLSTLDARQEANYQKFSARLGHRFCGDECRFLYGYLGGRWIYINVRQDSVGESSIGNGLTFVQERSWFHGGGVEIGVGGDADIWCGLGTAFRLGVIGAIGDRNFSHAANFQTINAALEHVSTRCVGGFEVRADLHYTYFCNCFWVRGEVGYEINYYLNPLLFASGINGIGSLFASDFGAGGLIFGITVGY